MKNKPEKLPGMGHLRGWRIVTSSVAAEEQAYWASLFTLGNGLLGVRGAQEEAAPGLGAMPMTLMAEVYDRPARLPGEPRKYRRPSRLVSVPNALCVTVRAGDTPVAGPSLRPIKETRALDMKRGTLERTALFRGADGRLTRIVSSRLVSQARPNIMALRYVITPLNYSAALTVDSFLDARGGYPDGIVQTRKTAAGTEGGLAWHGVRTLQSKAAVAAAARHSLSSRDRALPAEFAGLAEPGRTGVSASFHARRGAACVLEKIVSIHNGLHAEAPLPRAIAEARACPDFAALAREHAAEWASYWRDADLQIGGDRVAQTMARFFVFHLLQSASRNNARLGLSASIPAKSLSGPGYNGHVFWDTEIYMLPFFSQQYPEIAESLLRYRHDRLGAAARNAQRGGAAGARFPWESADTGLEECPKWLPRGTSYFRWKGGEQEVHISADIAMGYHQHVEATGNEGLLHGEALEVAVGTARYWATVARRRKAGPEDGAYHIRTVIGPDEYHSGIHDSVYTNAMAAWNLRWASQLLAICRTRQPQAYRLFQKKHGVSPAEMRRWHEIADNLRIHFDRATGLYEQFEGYFRHPRQQIKQADVLLMLHLLPSMSSPVIFQRNFDRYYPVTLHGSSLSPALHVLFSLDCGRPEKAYPYLRMTCEIDGLRRGDSTDEGLHSASLGAGWMAIVAGFGGVRVKPDHLAIAPRLPAHWQSLAFSTLYRGMRLRFKVTPRALTVRAEGGLRPVSLEIAGRRIRITAGAALRVTGPMRIPPARQPPRPAGPIQAVIFDLDGVIVSTDEHHYQAWQKLADAAGIPFDREVNHLLRGVSRMECLDIILKRGKKTYSDDERRAMAERKNDEYRGLLKRITSRDILPGVLILLDQLRARGIPTAIGSSSKNAGMILQLIGLDKAFDAVVDGNHISRSKPDPQVFLLAAKKLRVKPALCLVVEDAAAGVEAARSAGMKCLAVGAAAGHPGASISAPDLLNMDVRRLLGQGL